MKITIKYVLPLSKVVGKEFEQLPINKKMTVAEIVDLLVVKYGPEFGKYIYNQAPKNQDKEYRVVFKKNEIMANPWDMLKDGDKITLISALYGG